MLLISGTGKFLSNYVVSCHRHLATDTNPVLARTIACLSEDWQGSQVRKLTYVFIYLFVCSFFWVLEQSKPRGQAYVAPCI